MSSSGNSNIIKFIISNFNNMRIQWKTSGPLKNIIKIEGIIILLLYMISLKFNAFLQAMLQCLYVIRIGEFSKLSIIRISATITACQLRAFSDLESQKKLNVWFCPATQSALSFFGKYYLQLFNKVKYGSPLQKRNTFLIPKTLLDDGRVLDAENPYHSSETCWNSDAKYQHSSVFCASFTTLEVHNPRLLG